jgi:thiol-disulfide isomerase/thioredoxin
VFYAPDIYSKNHNLSEYYGKNVILWFSNVDCIICDDGLEVLSEIKEKQGDKIEVFSFSNDGKRELLEKYKDKIPNFNVMYNSKIFGEMMYAGSLKYPRLFFINKEGYITKVIPAETLKNDVKFVIEKMIGDFDEKR